MNHNVKDPGLEAFMRQLREGVIQPPHSSSVASTHPGESGGTGTGQSNKGDHDHEHHDSGGGGTGGTGDKGTGGEGSGANGKKPLLSREEITIILLAALFIFLLGLYLFVQKYSLNNQVQSLQQQPSAKTMSKSESRPQVQSAPAVRDITYVSTFNCSTQQEKDDNIQSAVVQQLQSGSTSRIMRRCALINIMGRVEKFDAKGYQLVVAVESIPGTMYTARTYSGMYDICGDTNGNSDKIPRCFDFLSQYAGRDILVITKDDGYVNIN